MIRDLESALDRARGLMRDALAAAVGDPEATRRSLSEALRQVEWVLGVGDRPAADDQVLAASPVVTHPGRGSLPSGPASVAPHGRLTFDLEVSDTSPVVHGTWVTVAHIVSLVVDGHGWPDILRMHPELEEDDIRAALAHAVAEQDGGPANVAPPAHHPWEC